MLSRIRQRILLSLEGIAFFGVELEMETLEDLSLHVINDLAYEKLT